MIPFSIEVMGRENRPAEGFMYSFMLDLGSGAAVASTCGRTSGTKLSIGKKKRRETSLTAKLSIKFY